MTAMWAWITGSLATIIMVVRSIFLCRLRLNRRDSTILIEHIFKTRWKLELYKEITDAPLPSIYNAFVWLGFFIRVDIQERMLQAGYVGVDNPCDVLVTRLGRKKLLAFLAAGRTVDNEINVYILRSWDAEKIGTLHIPDIIDTPYLPAWLYTKVDDLVSKTLEHHGKLGVMLWGPPGNGKTYFARYLAQKHKLPIYVVSFVPDMDNHDIIRMFSKISNPSLVLMEDFDSTFKGRRSLMKKSKFTFESILNSLDGLYASPRGTIFFMTANNIDNIDEALKNRPSRFRVVEKIDNPGIEVRERIFFGVQGDVSPDLKSLDELLVRREELINGMAKEGGHK